MKEFLILQQLASLGSFSITPSKEYSGWYDVCVRDIKPYIIQYFTEEELFKALVSATAQIAAKDKWWG